MAVNLLQRIALFALFSYLSTYLISTYAMSVGEVALPLAIVGVGWMIGSYMAGPVANRRNRMPVVAVCSVISGIAALFLLSFEPSVWVTVTIAMAAIGLFGLGSPVLIISSIDISGQSRATGVALLGASNQLGGVGGAALGGALLAAGRFQWIGYLCLGAAVLSAAIITLFMREPARKLASATGPVSRAR